jgi:hypothetical protein
MTRRLPAAVIAGAALALAACSGQQAPQQPATTGPTSAHGSLADCLKAQGMPESSGPAAVLGPPAGVDPAKWGDAMKACSDFAPGPAGP